MTTSEEKGKHICLVMMLHKADIWEVVPQLHRARQVLASWVCAAQLGLIYAADKAVSLQHSTLWGTLGETGFQFISDSPPTQPIHFRVFKAVKSIDQHLKLGPTPCPAQRIWWPRLFLGTLATLQPLASSSVSNTDILIQLWLETSPAGRSMMVNVGRK